MIRERNKSQLGGIYQIQNLINNKIYIESAKYIKLRFGIHKHLLRNGNHDNSYLQNAWNKYGESSFEFSILEIVSDVSQLEFREQEWIDKTKCYERNKGYNLRLVANNNIGISYNVGKKHSQETIKKIRAKAIGRKHSLETKQKQSERQKGKAPMRATLAAAKASRAKSKWPHGYKCRCDQCRIIRNEYLKNWRNCAVEL